MITGAARSLRFLREFARARETTGALCASSPFLARLIAQCGQVAQAESILEIGPGDGAFTREILQCKSAQSSFLTVERNAEFARMLRTQFPSLDVIEGCATELQTHIGSRNLQHVQSVVSGLPWAIFPCELQLKILAEIRSLLSPDGTFVTFAYFGPHLLPQGKKFRHRLREHFPTVSTSRVEMRNLPPAFVYIARGS